VASRIRRWIVDRFGLRPIWDTVLDRRVPRTPWYLGDGTALLTLFGIQIVTGILLALTYSPSATNAYESVQYITERQTLGWFIRAMHYWAGGMMVVMAFLHMCRQISLGGYKSPREVTWLVGVLLFFLIMTTSFLGYVLRWDDRGLAGLRVALAMFERVPAIGDELVVVVQGGPEISTITLTRLNALHVTLIPLLMVALVAYHLYLIVFHGTTAPAEHGEHVDSAAEQRDVYHEQAESQTEGEVFYPTAMIKIAPWSVVALALVLGLSLTVGARQLGSPAGQMEPSHPAEEWWFAWYSGLIALLPPSVAPAFMLIFPLAIFLILILLPFIDRNPNRGWRYRPIATTIVLLVVLALIGLTSLRQRSPWGGWPKAGPPPVPHGVELAADAEQGRQLFARYGCNSCHAIAGVGKDQIGSDLADLTHLYSHDELRHYILYPPEGVAMPRYAGRIPNEDLDFVAAFVLVAQTFPKMQDH
jgi:ubiquinol-cytochrome c reductase cytochrome b subunit